jgi:hypothetical protein
MHRQKLIPGLGTIAVFLLLLISTAPAALAGQPIIWETSSRAELLKGESQGVSVSDTGTLMLAPRFAQLFNTEQPYVWSSAIDGQGNIYLGTGHDGRIFRVSPDGHGAMLYDAAELDVTALAIGRDGALYAGTSPEGKVYRIAADGHAEIYFAPPDKYIWALAFMTDGSLAVATGDNGKLYRVRTAGAKAESSLLINTNQTHVMSLAVTAQGDLIAGTDPGGLVLRISPDGKAFGLFDAQLREIHALAPAADGSIYVLALGEAATTTRQPAAASASQPPESGGSATTSTPNPADESAAALQQSAGDCSPVATIPRTRAAQSSEYCRMEVLTPFGRQLQSRLLRLRRPSNRVACLSAQLTRDVSIQ